MFFSPLQLLRVHPLKILFLQVKLINKMQNLTRKNPSHSFGKKKFSCKSIR